MTKKDSIKIVTEYLEKAYKSAEIDQDKLEVNDSDIKEIYNVVIKVIRGYCKSYDLEQLNKQQSILDKFEVDLLHKLELATKKNDLLDITYQLKEVRRLRRICKHNVVKVLFYNEAMDVLGALNSKSMNKAVKNFQTCIKSEKSPHYTPYLTEEGFSDKKQCKKFEVSCDIVDETKPPNERVFHWKQEFECKNSEEAKEEAIQVLEEQGIRVWSKLKVRVK